MGANIMSVEIREAKSLRELKEFVLFSFPLYKNNKYWVPPLIKGQVDTLRPDKNPAFEYCEAIYLLAYKDKKVAGRIAGIINRKFIEMWKKKYARFCWIDFIDDEEVSRALLKGVEQWARSKGLEGIHGPLGFTTFDQQGMLIEGFNELATFASVYNYDYYPRHMEKLGYQKEVDYFEFEIKDNKVVPEKAERICNIIMKRDQLRLFKAKSKKDLLPYAKQVFDVINASYSPLFGFVPLTEKQIDMYVKKFFSYIQPDFVAVILDKNDRVIGFQITMPSLSRAFQKAKGRLLPFGFIHILRALKKPKSLDFLLVGILPEYQNKGVNALFMTDMTKTARQRGISTAETNAELEHNVKVQNFWKDYDPRLHKKKRIYLKLFDEQAERT